MRGSARVPRGGRFVRRVLFVVAGLFAARIVFGAVFGGAIHPVTVFGLFGGLAGGAAAVTVSSVVATGPPPWDRLWMPVLAEDDQPRWQTGGSPAPGEETADPGAFTAMGDWRRTRYQLLFFTLAGGIYPWILGPILDVPGATWAALPSSIGTGVLWACVTFAIAAVTYHATGTLVASARDGRDWLATATAHLAFGLVFGATVGLWLTVFAV